MKKLLLCIALTIVAPLSYAGEAEGRIEEVKVCGAGESGANSWIRTLQFKVDGKWFGTYADHYGTTQPSMDNDISTWLVYMAFSQNLPVKVVATDDWGVHFQGCGVTDGHVFHENYGDYISIIH